ISVHANQARIGELPDKPDKDSFFYSANVRSFAIERKLYNPESGKPFRFDDAYGNIDAKSKRVCESRVWSVFRRAAPSQTFDPAYHRGNPNAKPYSWSIKPDKKLSTADIMALMRDNYEGTDYDMTKGIDAGNYGTPRRWRPLYWKIENENADKDVNKNSGVDEDEYAWERPISTQQTGFSIVTQSRSTLPDEIGGVLWYGVDDSYLSCYFPLYCCISELPKSYTVGSIKEFSWDSAWWVFNLVSNYANLKYSVIAPEIIAVQKEFETKFFTLQTPVEKTATEIFKTNPDLAKRYLTDYSVSQAESVAASWKKLATEIFTKHNDGYYVTEDGSRPNEKSAYPQDWLKRVLKEKPEAFKLPKEPTRNQIGYFEQPLTKLLERSIEAGETNKDKAEDLVDEIKQNNPNLFFAEAGLIDAFKNKTFDQDKCKTKIKEAIKKLPETKQTELQKILIKQFEKENYEGNELEIIRRALE
ncbi:MAG: C69 family dipeptidase, partial [Planctomycetaceae bacterium]|nr:C69 family dipeptidase [Planctomycetaceae bacterium]